MTNANLERELKLVPIDEAMLDRLAAVDQLGELVVKRRWQELQRNSYFDTPSRALTRARVGFRRRTIQGQSLATWSLKAGDEQFPHVRGIATRSEIELQLDPDMPPALALGALRTTARQRGAVALAELVGDALAQRELPLARPMFELETNRTAEDLEAEAHGWAVELALDRVQMVGHEYREVEIEVELKQGDEAALDSARQAIEALGPIRESDGTKLSRALAYFKRVETSTS
jgi:inorganic triphosphatase YgiF